MLPNKFLHEWVPPCIACQNGKLRCGYSPDLLAILQGNPGLATPVFASVATPAVLAILQVQQVAGTAIFSSGAPLDLLAIRPFHNSKRHFPNGNRRQPPPCLPKSETDGRCQWRRSRSSRPLTASVCFATQIMILNEAKEA